MDVEMEKPSTPAPANDKPVTSRPQTSRARAAAVPEVDLYIHLIILLYLIDRNALKSVRRRSRTKGKKSEFRVSRPRIVENA